MIGDTGIPPGPGAREGLGEDTVELQLTVAEQLELSRAADAASAPAQAVPAAPASVTPGYDTFVYARTRRADVVGTITFALLVCGVTAAAGWHALIRQPAARPIVVAAPIAHAAAAPVPSQPGVVQVLNPFDDTEVFELPSDITETDARNAIAQLLLQRAQERHRQGLDLHHRSAPRLHRVAAVKPSDVFVTRVLGPPDRFTDSPGGRSATGVSE